LLPHDRLLARATTLSVISVVWGASIASAGLVIAIQTGSLALAGFALDSGIDSVASAVLVWRFQVERRDPHRAELVERRATLAVGITLVLSGLYVGAQAVRGLVVGTASHFTIPAFVLAGTSLVVLLPLGLMKRAVARALPSRALVHDSFLTLVGAALAGLALAGEAAGRLLGLGSADAVAALLIAVVLMADGAEAIRTRDG
jgi:divalent metal cation (Fe/Co/Zn/Cd) transporter